MHRTLVVTLAATFVFTACQGRSKPTSSAGPGPGAPTDIQTLAAFDPAAIGPGAPPKPGPARPLGVLDYGPIGRAASVGSFHVRFNQPVVPLDLADSTGLEKQFTSDPPLPGRAYWKTPDLLVYELTADPPDCHEYTVRFTGEIVGLDGQRYAEPLTWKFETARPSVSGSLPGSQPVSVVDVDEYDGEVFRRDQVVLVEFDRAVALTEVQAHIKASARPFAARTAGKPVPVRVREASKAEYEEAGHYGATGREKTVYAVRPAGLWPGASEVEVSVATGLRSLAGPLPLDTPWSMVFRTYSAQTIVSSTCPLDDPCGLEPISLRLRNPIEEDQLRKITVAPRPRNLQLYSGDDFGDGGHEVVIEGQFVPETTYTVRVPESVRDIYGQHIPGGATRSARIAARATLALSDESGILRAGNRQTIGVESRHVRAIDVRVGIYTDEEFARVPHDADIAILPFPARVLTRSYALEPRGKADWSSLALDLADLTGNARRPVLVEVTPTAVTPAADAYALPDTLRGLFHLTDLGPIVTVSQPASSLQVLRLTTGAAVAGAKVHRADASGRLTALGTTDRDGLLALPAELLPPRKAGDEQPQRMLQLGVVDPAADDHAHIHVHAPEVGPRRPASAAEPSPSPLRPGERLISRVVSERGVYRPGEKVRLVGWSAVDTPFARSNLGRLPTGTPVVFTLTDSFGREVATHATRTTADGKYWAELTVPADARLGRYTAQAKLAGVEVRASVKVEDYRVPEFTVEATARRKDILAGEQVAIDAHASYYFGGPVQIRRLSHATHCQLTRYRPPGLEDMWDVGEPTPYGYRRPGNVRVVAPEPGAPTPGRREFTAGSDLEEQRHPQRCTTSVEVQDASLQGIGAEAGFAVHPAAFYLAVAPPDGYLEAGARDTRLPLRAVTVAGQRTAVANVELAVTRHWTERGYRSEGGKQVFDKWIEREAKVKTCKFDLREAGEDPACVLPPLQEGRYELRASASEPGSARVARTTTSFRVYARQRPVADASWRSAPIERLEVLTSKADVKPGDALEVAVRGPWPGARGTLVLARGGVREVLPVELKDREALFKFTVDDTWTPQVYLLASVVQPPGPGGRPEVEHAEAVVRQDFEHRRLAVTVDAPVKAGPGEQVVLGVRVRDAAGAPTAARVALWAVDEAVLDLTGHTTPDLQPEFVPKRHAELSRHDDYRRILYPFTPTPYDPWFAPARGSSYGRGFGSGHGSGAGYGGSVGGAAGPPPARSRFETTPVFLADLAVDATGDARVKATLPDNLTTFRITAIASARLADGVSPGRFGKNDARTVVTAPLVLRAAMPRQLRPGDSAELAAIVQNNTGRAGRLEVTAKVVEKPGSKGHVLKFSSPTSAAAELADGGQARLTFQVDALGPGAPEVELQAALTPSGGPAVRDGVRLPLPVAAERTLTERVAAYGSVTDDQAVAVPIKLPADVLPGHGGVTVATTSTLLGGLEDAVHALVQYPYGCVEQTSSRLLPLVVLGQLRKDYPLGIPDTAEFMRVGVERLLAMQTDSGGFAYWPGGTSVHVYASAYATWVLQLAHAAGHPVPRLALDRALDDLAGRVGDIPLAQLPVDWGFDSGVRVAIALHVLAEAGRDVGKQAAALYTQRQRLPLFARAFLLMALHRGDPRSAEVAALKSELLGSVRETQGTAHTAEVETYSLAEFFSSDGRSDAITLMALLRVQPDHPVVEKLARGLLERRIGGAWRNTQENAYALVVIADYARVHEAAPPDFQARAWVAGASVLDVKFAGRDTATRSSFTDMATILGLPRPADQALLPVILQRQGEGRMYYRLGAEWAPAQTDLPARDQGFVVARALRTTGGAATTSVPAGEPIAMDITLRSSTRVRYVVLDVPLPAGLEGVSRTLGKGRSAAVLGGRRGWWVSHEEQRPDRVLVFADDLPPGTHTHTIDLRSTGRGRFSFPPAQAEAMYMPEVYGRTAGAALEVR